MANGHGGKRKGAGRKPRAERLEKPINAAERQIVKELPAILAEHIKLARGQVVIVEETYEPAGTIQIDKIEMEEGKVFRTKELAFPHLDPETPVLVKKVVRRPGPHQAAGAYLADRILGKPTTVIEDTTPEERRLPPDLEAMIEKVYGSNETGSDQP